MKNLKFVFAIAFALVFIVPVFAQDASTYKLTKKGIVKTFVTQDSKTEEMNVLKPILIFKGRYEMDTESGESRFALRNSRVGVQGDVSKFLSYKFMMDLSDNGKLRVLDIYATIKPLKGLSFTFGQGGLPIYNSYTTSPNSIDFANRPFIGKYIFSSRDIGLTANYKIKQKGFPIAVEAGVYNGDGINNPVWTKSLAYSGRILFGSMKGFRATAKFLSTKVDETENTFIWGADARYENSDFKVEAEYMTKKNTSEIGNPDGEVLALAYAQTLVKLPVNSKTFKRIEPCFRWDGAGYDIAERGLGCNRATAGVNFVFNTDVVTSLFRINYEHFFNNTMDMSRMFSNPQQNESNLSVELLLVF